MRIVVALGGSVLLRRAEPADAASQRSNVEGAAGDLATIAAEHDLVITHGNSPPDVLGVESEGMVGCMLELALRNALPGRDLVTLLTEVVVDEGDPAFATPSKPIGPTVPFPEPQAIVELRSMRLLVDAGVLVICAGGGGIPVALDGGGALKAVEAVVDEDLTASLLARRLDADLLLLLTDVDAVYLDWGDETASKLTGVAPEELRRQRFQAGTIGPKVDAACRFVESTSRRAAIGELKDAVAIVHGGAGTQVSPHPS